jgi:hypothetical protein
MLLHFGLINTSIIHDEIAKALLIVSHVIGCNVLLGFPFLRPELRFYLSLASPVTS